MKGHSPSFLYFHCNINYLTDYPWTDVETIKLTVLQALTSLNYYVFENIMKNGAFALLTSIFYNIFKSIQNLSYFFFKNLCM